MYKAYYATGKWKDCATVVFAENRGKAKSLAMASEALLERVKNGIVVEAMCLVLSGELEYLEKEDEEDREE